MTFDVSFSWSTVLIAAAIAGAALLLVRRNIGPPASNARRWILIFLRTSLLAILAVLFFNPVKVTETPGPIQRPEVYCLLDASQSMLLGSPKTRWEESLDFLRTGLKAPDAASGADVKLF